MSLATIARAPEVAVALALAREQALHFGALMLRIEQTEQTRNGIETRCRCFTLDKGDFQSTNAALR